MIEKQVKYCSKFYHFFTSTVKRWGILWQILIVYVFILTSLIGFLIVLHYLYYQDLINIQNTEIYFSLLIKKILMNQTDLYIGYVNENIKEENLISNRNTIFYKVLLEEYKRNDMYLSSSSVLTSISRNFTKVISDNLAVVVDSVNYELYFNQNEERIFENKKSLINNTSSDNKNYFLGDAVKVFYIYMPLIIHNFKLNNITILSGFLTAYPILSSKLSASQQTQFQNETNTISYFQFPYQYPYSFNIQPGVFFHPIDYNNDPVPYLYSLNRFDVYAPNWLTEIDLNTMMSNNTVKSSEFRIMKSKDSCYTVLSKEKIISLLNYKTEYDKITIFFNIGFKYTISQTDKTIMNRIDYFSIFNYFGNTTYDLYKRDFINNENSFHLYLSNSLPFTVNNQQFCEYFSYDNSRSIFANIPVIYNKIYQNALTPLNSNGKYLTVGSNIQNLKKLMYFNKNFEVSYYFKNEAFLYFFVYYVNMFNFFSTSENQFYVEKQSPKLEKEILSKSFYETCKSLNFTEYYSTLLYATPFDCLSDDSIEIMKTIKSNPQKLSNSFQKLLNCYCSGFLCFNVTDPDFKQIFLDNYTINVKTRKQVRNYSITIDPKIEFPIHCSINIQSKSSLENDSILNTFRILVKHNIASFTKFTDFTTIFMVDDHESNNVFFLYVQYAADLTNNIYIVYSVILSIILLFFTRLTYTKTIMLREKLILLSNIYLKLLNSDSDSYYRDNYFTEAKTLKRFQLKAIALEQLSYNDDNIPLKQQKHKNSFSKNKIKNKRSIFNDVHYTRSKDNKLPEIEEYDEMDEIYCILYDNLDVFNIDFNTETMLDYSDTFLKQYENSIMKNRKLQYIFQNDERFLKNSFGEKFFDLIENENVEFSKCVLKELCSLPFFISNNISKNFQFKYSKYSHKDTNPLIRSISSYFLRHSFRKETNTIQTTENIETESYLGTENYVEKVTLYHKMDELIEFSCVDMNSYNFKDIIVQKDKLSSTINYYLDNIFNVWLEKIDKI